MFKRLRKLLFIKVKKYDKKAENPFLNTKRTYDCNKTIYQQTYIWVENNV